MTLTEAVQRLSAAGCTELREADDAKAALKRLAALYRSGVQVVGDAFEEVGRGTPVGSIPRSKGCYPIVAYPYDGSIYNVPGEWSSGFFRRGPGLYYTTLRWDDILFSGYLGQQLERIQQAHEVKPIVGISSSRIRLKDAVVGKRPPSDYSSIFYQPSSTEIGQSNIFAAADEFPLSRFSALQTDKALSRLRYYTGTEPSKFGRWILLTNYNSYVEEFRDFAKTAVGQKGYTEFVEPPESLHANEEPQMPAYHLVRKNGEGITLINIGVGPSNAKNIVDNVMKLRPHLVLMVGHCAGLRRNQRIGQLVLANDYFRHDRIMDDYVPTSRPVSPIAEVNQALRNAVAKVFEIGRSKTGFGERLETVRVVTTGDRNWEDELELVRLFEDMSGGAVDMESATVGAVCDLHGVAHGTLLIISDKPTYGEDKDRDGSRRFRHENVGAHLKIAIRTVESLRRNLTQLHSRMLVTERAPVFR